MLKRILMIALVSCLLPNMVFAQAGEIEEEEESIALPFRGSFFAVYFDMQFTNPDDWPVNMLVGGGMAFHPEGWSRTTVGLTFRRDAEAAFSLTPNIEYWIFPHQLWQLYAKFGVGFQKAEDLGVAPYLGIGFRYWNSCREDFGFGKDGLEGVCMSGGPDVRVHTLVTEKWTVSSLVVERPFVFVTVGFNLQVVF